MPRNSCSRIYSKTIKKINNMDLVNDKIPVKIKLDGGIMPQKKSKQAAAYDLYCPDNVNILSNRQVIDLKFKIEMPPYLKADIRPRSGYSAKGFELRYITKDGNEEKVMADIDVILGTIDSDYRGNVGVILKVHHIPVPIGNVGLCYIPKGERIAQMAFSFVPDAALFITESLDMSVDRGGGFGHTNE